MIKAHQIKLYPTKSQERLLRQSCGVARFAFNWALNKWKTDYENGIKQSVYSLVKYLNSIKREQFPWMQETGKTCSQYAIHNVGRAYKKMWEEKRAYPKFKKKGDKDSFIAVEKNKDFKQSKNKIWIPRIGWVKCAENLRFEGKVNYVAVKRVADIWLAVINIEIENIPIEAPVTSENQAVIGVDMGIKSMMVLSDGTVYENPKALRRGMKSLKRSQRSLTRKVKGSSNRKKQQMKVARKHFRVSCIRKNAIHQATSEIVKKYDKIVIETLKPRNMVKNRKLAQAISDVSFGEIARQLAYKAQWAGKELVKADQWFASSKICSCCGNKKEVLKLSERIYKCESCGLEIDRDLNAAKNLASYSPTSKFEGSEACGEVSEPRKVQRNSVKQEVNKLSNNIVQQCTSLKNL